MMRSSVVLPEPEGPSRLVKAALAELRVDVVQHHVAAP